MRKRWRRTRPPSGRCRTEGEQSVNDTFAHLTGFLLFTLGEGRAGPAPNPFTMKIKILCTLGPASLRGDVIRALEERGVDLFRINLSHTPPEAVEPTIALIRRYSNTPICLDSQGAQVRCGKMAEGVTLKAGTQMTLCAEDVCVVPPRGLRQLHWPLPDPAAVDGSENDVHTAFRRTRDDIERRVRELIETFR